MKKFSTRSYKLQVLLMEVEEIKIVDVVKENYKGKMSSKLEFEFTEYFARKKGDRYE